MIRIFRNNRRNHATADGMRAPRNTLQPTVVLDAVEQAAVEKPYIEQEVTGRELHDNILEALRDQSEARIETAIGVMASLAGFCCLYPVYAKYERGEIFPEQSDFQIEVAPDGTRYFYGNMIDDRLFGGEDSVCEILFDKGKRLGITAAPDISSVVAHSQSVMGTRDFGMVRVSQDHCPRDLPSNFVRYLMPSYIPLLRRYDPDPEKFRHSFAFAVCRLMEQNCETLSPDLALKIAIECAVPMSRLDPAEVY